MNEDCTLLSESSQILCVPVGVWRGEGRVPRCHFVQGSTAPVRVYKCTDCCSQTDFELRLLRCSTNSRKLFILWKNGNWKLWLPQWRSLSKFWLFTVLKSIYFCLQLNCCRLSHRHNRILFDLPRRFVGLCSYGVLIILCSMFILNTECKYDQRSENQIWPKMTTFHNRIVSW